MATILFGSAMFNWSETQRMIEIATALYQRGHKIVFIGEGKYDFLLQQHPDFIRAILPADREWYTNERVQKMLAMDKYGNNYATSDEIDAVVKQELELIDRYKPKAIVTGYRMTLSVTARIAKIPIFWVLSAVLSMPYLEPLAKLGKPAPPKLRTPESIAKFASMVEDHIMTSRMIGSNKTSAAWNQCLATHCAHLLQCDMELFQGDFYLISDAKEVYSQLSEKKCKFIGPIFNSEKITIEPDQLEILKEDSGRRKIFVSIGSAGTKRYLETILKAIMRIENCEVFVSVIGALSEHEQAAYPKNFHFQDKYPLIQIARYCDVAVTLGGQGTIYAMLYAGCPFVAFPHSFEQRNNIINIMRTFSCGEYGLQRNISTDEVYRMVSVVLVDPTYRSNAKRAQSIIAPYYEDPAMRAENVAAITIEAVIQGKGSITML